MQGNIFQSAPSTHFAFRDVIIFKTVYLGEKSELFNKKKVNKCSKKIVKKFQNARRIVYDQIFKICANTPRTVREFQNSQILRFINILEHDG